MHDARCTIQDPVLFLLRAHHETIAKLKGHFPDGMRNRASISPQDELYIYIKKKKKVTGRGKCRLSELGKTITLGLV